jgi:hypothetical protein
MQVSLRNLQAAVEGARTDLYWPPHDEVEEPVEEETFPDIGSMSDEELKELIDNLTSEEQEVSYRRRILHGQIDILRAELVNRLRDNRPEGDTLIKGDDVERLSEILAGRSDPPTKPPT